MRQGPIERLVAVKTLHVRFLEEDSFVEMFEAESRVSGMIRHANVIGVLGAGASDEGPYLVMDYVEGVSVSTILKGTCERGSLPLGLALDIAEQAALGLSAAHELTDADGAPLGVVHRDVSPQNLLAGVDGVVRLLDFGIAKITGSDKTSTGVLKGKIGYMAPEQLCFERPDHRTDLFALGVVLFELLTGQRLYRGDYRQVAKSILDGPVPDILDFVPSAPPELAELLFELLAKDPAERPQSAKAVADRLRAIRTLAARGEDLGEFIRSTFATELSTRREKLRAARIHARPTRPRTPRWRRFVFALAAVLALIAITTLAWQWNGEPSPSVPVDAVAVEVDPAARITPTPQIVVPTLDDGELTMAATSRPTRRRNQRSVMMRTNKQGLVGW